MTDRETMGKAVSLVLASSFMAWSDLAQIFGLLSNGTWDVLEPRFLAFSFFAVPPFLLYALEKTDWFVHYLGFATWLFAISDILQAYLAYARDYFFNFWHWQGATDFFNFFASEEGGVYLGCLGIISLFSFLVIYSFANNHAPNGIIAQDSISKA